MDWINDIKKGPIKTASRRSRKTCVQRLGLNLNGGTVAEMRWLVCYSRHEQVNLNVPYIVGSL